MEEATVFSALKANGRAMGPTNTAAVSASVGLQARSTTRPSQPVCRWGRWGSAVCHIRIAQKRHKEGYNALFLDWHINYVKVDSDDPEFKRQEIKMWNLSK
jgi:prepilin-type processing-associated H-X9-DG protein